MAAAIMCDTAVSMLDEEKHLWIPCIGAERPPMREGHNWAASPVLVIDLGVIPNPDHRHFETLLVCEAGFVSEGCLAYLRSSTISDRNQARRSVSSIRFSIRLALATSPCLSHNSWAERRLRVSSRLSARSSESISSAATFSALLSFKR